MTAKVRIFFDIRKYIDTKNTKKAYTQILSERDSERHHRRYCAAPQVDDIIGAGKSRHSAGATGGILKHASRQGEKHRR